MNSNNPADNSSIPELNKNIADKNEIKEEFMRFKAQDVVFFKEESLASFPEVKHEEKRQRTLSGFPNKKSNFFDERKDIIKPDYPCGKRNEDIPFKSYLFSNKK